LFVVSLSSSAYGRRVLGAEMTFYFRPSAFSNWLHPKEKLIFFLSSRQEIFMQLKVPTEELLSAKLAMVELFILCIVASYFRTPHTLAHQ
jgi:hypothetical protein